MSNEHREQAREIAEQVMNQIAVGAWQFCSREWNIENCAKSIASALSSRDAEVREVLEGLARPCWCPPDYESEPHSPTCLAARKVWEEVKDVD